jgi:hypothetical protein
MTCPVCKQPFTPRTRQHAYCTIKCQRRAKYLRTRGAVLARQKAWRAANPDKVQAARQRPRNPAKIAAEKAARAARRAKMARLRPKCIICNGPLPWHKPSFPLSATTCGGKCAKLRIRWFGAQRPRRKKRAA